MDKRRDDKNRRVVKKLVLLGLAMFGFGFLLVPLYSAFCDITGLNGKTGRIEAAEAAEEAVDLERTITVEFIANVRDGMQWEFRPLVSSIKVHPGVLMDANFMVTNQGTTGVTGRAVPSVAPGEASRYFNKTECFCFTEQRLDAGESREMPLKFIVGTDLPRGIKRLTLSYTFFSVDKASG